MQINNHFAKPSAIHFRLQDRHALMTGQKTAQKTAQKTTDEIIRQFLQFSKSALGDIDGQTDVCSTLRT